MSLSASIEARTWTIGDSPLHFPPRRPWSRWPRPPAVAGKRPKNNDKSKPPGKAEGPVLVVEDDPSILSTVADILEFEGYQVEQATNGQEALAAMERARPALVLLDMRMPVMNGWDFAQILKERGIDVPILVMTAARDARRWAQEINAEGYIPKPFEITDLLAAVERLLGGNRGPSTRN